IPDPKKVNHWLIIGEKNYETLIKKGIFSCKVEYVVRYSGNELVGVQYDAPFRINPLKPLLRDILITEVHSALFVNATDGTGIVHTAVMYGEDDFKLGKEKGLRMQHTVYPDGTFSVLQELGILGKYVKDQEVERKLILYLQENDLLFGDPEKYKHDYPHCWRCQTPLLYYARKAWWVRTTEVKKQLLANNETITWVPEHLKKGRFGEFLKDVRDWAFSRERYWGTPLPIWRCVDCGEIEVIGSIDELRKKSPASQNRYLMMRHGQALSNVRGITSSKGEGHHLTPKGRKQVQFAAKKLFAHGGSAFGGKKQKIDMIVSSSIPRARETAEIMAKMLGVPLHIEDRLKEINVGVLDGRATKEYHAFFSSFAEKFTKRPAEGEHLGDVRGRVLNWMEDMEKKHQEKTILVVSHEYPLWMMYAGADGLTNSQSLALRTGKRKDDFIAVAEVMPASYVSLPRDETGEINLHRPFVDLFIFPCKKCKGEMRRVPEVADVWFDSGAMPFAQVHYPFEKEKFAFPADYIAEAVDQTRGWFYTLLAISTLLGKKAPYKNVISLGHVLDKNGQKMSKSKGNVVSPWDMIQKYGIDTLRWYFYSINAPGEPKRFDEKDLLLKQRSFLGTWWNSFVLFDTYVKKVKSQKLKVKSVAGKEHVLDVWIKELTGQLIREVTAKLDVYDITGASRAIEQFAINDFSQWYLRRSRERFQRPKSVKEKEDASSTTAYVLDTLCRLAAPFTPFLSEYMYQELRKKTGQKEISVHLLSWPVPMGPMQRGSIEDMERVRSTVAAALKLRADAGIKVRQPLQALCITDKKLSASLLDLIRDEVNVKEILFGKEMILDTVLTPELKEEGMVREFTRNIQEMRRDLGLMPRDLARVMVSGDTQLEAILTRWCNKIRSDTNLREISMGGKKIFGNQREVEIDGKKCLICLSVS
ncbi:MAG: class I tRNA ligase family protein, partial [Candidatus Sungbacteria bacterium]|nr:class I tRNA ligase family protein [Candidatus Sungbacteria bacterium]